MSKSKIGKEGEEVAVQYLIEKGFIILERNFRKYYGELDIVAWKDSTIYGIEVKCVKKITDDFHPLYKMSPQKLNKMKNLIQTYIKCNKIYSSCNVSLSLLVVHEKSKVEFYSDLFS